MTKKKKDHPPLRIVTAASLFDGHDATIHVMRRIMQAQGAEVIHLGHNRSAWEVVKTALEEDADAIAITSYQGGHVEYFCYIIDLLKEHSASHIKVFGGGGGVISPDEVKLLESYGVSKIYTPHDGQEMGLEGMIEHLLNMTQKGTKKRNTATRPNHKDKVQLARWITRVENDSTCKLSKFKFNKKQCPVIGFTGTGGAGKSSLIDEVISNLLKTIQDIQIAIISVDPSRRRSGGALLGDRLRMLSASADPVFMRSMATRSTHSSVTPYLKKAVDLCRIAEFDLIILETAGTGQSDSRIIDISDLSIYVMTPEYGAATQLEKIDMLDFSDFTVVNKSDKTGALDALKDVQKTVRRNRKCFNTPLDELGVFATCSSLFNDTGVKNFTLSLLKKLNQEFPDIAWLKHKQEAETHPVYRNPAPENDRYLKDISNTVEQYHQETNELIKNIETLQSLSNSLKAFGVKTHELPKKIIIQKKKNINNTMTELSERFNQTLDQVEESELNLISQFREQQKKYLEESEGINNNTKSLSGLNIPKVSLPDTDTWPEQYTYMRQENIPGKFPFTAGVFPFKRDEEAPTRMFAGEGTAERTNKRFHLLSHGQSAIRLSTAFDSVTLYGENPALTPDVFGKIGNAGVSICCLDDMKRLFSGFDLSAPNTSVSMTINGPAPSILAYFFNTAIDAAIERKLRKEKRWSKTQKAIQKWFKQKNVKQPIYRDELPKGHDGSGLGFLGVSSEYFVPHKEYQDLKEQTLKTLRGTVQADILKEDQAQNTCIFSTAFSLRMMGDVQEYFCQNGVRHFYSVSISGYHIAEAGATPVTQLAFTLANAFTYVETYLNRGMKIDDFAPNFSFFFSNGLDPEYAVLARVARRIWAIAIRDLYGGNERSQKLKCHIQTSGRSLHAKEIDFNDIRTTLQALYAISDHCNSLHTNAYDEALTTPTESSVRRAVAIQMIILKELGLTKNQNPFQGSYFIESLTREVEKAVLVEFSEINKRGGVLGAMENQYQRNKIQEESLEYEQLKHKGELPIIGVNTFLNENDESDSLQTELIRSSKKERQSQVTQVKKLKQCFKKEANEALENLKHSAYANDNLFASLLEATKVCSLGEITSAMRDIGGAYRRNM